MSAKHEPAMTRSGGTARSLAQLVPKLARAVMGKRGFAEAGLLSDWQAVVGADIAAKALPERLDFPRGERRDGTLHLSVTGAWALACTGWISPPEWTTAAKNPPLASASRSVTSASWFSWAMNGAPPSAPKR